MKNKFIYIDESGQEGGRLFDFTQDYYVLAGLEETEKSNINLIDKLLMNSIKKYKYRQGELKSTKLNKKPSDLKYMIDILNVVIQNGYNPYLAIVQKKNMAAITLANLLLDEDFNYNIQNYEDFIVVYKKYKISKYFLYTKLLNLPEENLNKFYLNFLKCEKITEFENILEDIQSLKDILINNTNNYNELIEYIFEGFFKRGKEKLLEFFEGKIYKNTGKDLSTFKQEKSINYFTLGTIIHLISKNSSDKFNIIHDNTDFSEIYLNHLEFFKYETMLNELKFSDSKNILQLQFADLLAGLTFYMFNNYKKYNCINKLTFNTLEDEKYFEIYKEIEKFIISNTKLLENIHIICDKSFHSLKNKYAKYR